MITLRIDLAEGSDKCTQLVMTAITPFGDARCSGLLLNDRFMRPIHYDHIVVASDISTGELICPRLLCGARPPPGPIESQPERRARPTGKTRTKASEIFAGQRRKDRNDFFRTYHQEIIWNHFRNKLISSFNGRCFACSSPKDLQMDHHVPLALGGKREPGNIVMLCASCNQRKWDYPPEMFYSQDELRSLEPLLKQQTTLLEFNFDPTSWYEEPIPYLTGIGLSPLLLHEAASNPNHEWHHPHFAA